VLKVAVASRTAAAAPRRHALPTVQRSQELTVGFWQDVYKGDLGRVRFGAQYEFVQLDLFNGTGSIAGGLHPNNNIFFVSARYYPFNQAGVI
jgi:hypothetical protein